MADKKPKPKTGTLKVATDSGDYSQLELRWIELCRAAYRGDLKEVNRLLTLKVLPSCADPSNVARPTPLHYAALRGTSASHTVDGFAFVVFGFRLECETASHADIGILVGKMDVVAKLLDMRQ